MLELLGALTIMMAQPPGGADIECVINGLSEQAAEALATELVRGRGEPSAAVLRPLEQAAAACQAQRRWTADQTGQATALALASLMGVAADEQLVQAGIEADAIERWFKAQNETVQTRLDIADADAERLGAALLATGVSLQKLTGAGEAVGLYLGSLIIFARVLRGLPID